jgi:glycerate kinase
MVAQLEAGTRHWAAVVAGQLGLDLADHPGAGAAGGVGAGSMAFLRATLQPGAATLLDYAGFADQARGCQWIITGEGRLDAQTAHGKLIHAVARAARAAGVPVLALCGSLAAQPADLDKLGLRAAFSISEGPGTLAAALEQTEAQLERMGWQLGRLLPGS